MSAIIRIGIFAILIFILPAAVISQPALPTEFYGKVTSYNTPAASGSVKVYAGSTLCGSFSIVNGGYYGVLSCLGDDNQTGAVEGGMQGQNLTFRLNTNPVTAFGDTLFN